MYYWQLLLQRLEHPRSELIAFASALLLSLACLFRGAVDDAVISLLLVAYIPLLWLAAPMLEHTHALLRKIGILILVSLIIVLSLQWILPSNHLGTLALSPEILPTGISGFHRIHAMDLWLGGIARALFFAAAFVTALAIGSIESCARHFLQYALMFGSCCVAFTFFTATNQGIPTSAYFAYSHGMVNANNAAAYLGIMLLVGIAEICRFFRIPSRLFSRGYLLQLLDSLQVEILITGGLLLFSVVLSFAALLMTGSRAGITLSLVAAALFSGIILKKLHTHSQLKRRTVGACAVFMAVILGWCFLNYGQVFSNKLSLNGLDSNTRFDIYRSIIPMIADHPLLGVGLGGFAVHYQQYRPTTISPDGIIDKAHNSYLEFASEMGLPALVVLVIAACIVLLLFVRGIIERKERYINPSLGFVVLLYVALFSFIDFPLQIPGIAALFISIIVVCCSQTDRRFSDPPSHAHSHAHRVRIRKRR